MDKIQKLNNIFGKPNTISDKLFNCANVKYVNIFHKTSAAFTHKPETSGEITFCINDTEGRKKFEGSNIFEVLEQMSNFLKTLQ